MRFINKRHNNRKMTPGRIHTGGRKGYVPNEIIRARKHIKSFQREIDRIENLPAAERVKNAPKVNRLRRHIETLKFNLENYA